MEELKSTLVLSSRLRLFSDSLVLKNLCNPQAVEDLESIRSSLSSDHDQEGNHFPLMHGYKLVVATTMYELLNNAILCPELLGVEPDIRFQEWWVSNLNQQGIASGSAFTDPESDYSKVISSINGAMWRLRIASNWELTMEALRNANFIGTPVWSEASKCTPVALRDRVTATVDVNEALRRAAVERLYDYVEDRKFGLAYEFLWSVREELNFGNSWSPDEDPLSEIETHLGPRPLLFPIKRSGPNWLTGIRAAMSVAISQLAKENRGPTGATELFKEISDSPPRLKGLLTHEMGGTYPSQEFGLAAPLTIPVDELISAGSSRSDIPAEERLQGLVGHERGLVVSNGPTEGTIDFPIIMNGLTSTIQQGDLIEVLHIKHTNADDDYLTWFSLAVREARFGLFSNFSKWWVFYKAYATGPMRDTEVVRAEKCVAETLENLVDNINLIEMEDIDTDTLLDLFEPPGWRYVLEQAKRATQVNWDLKGGIPELLATTLLAHWNCLHIRTSFEPRVLQDRGQKGELDSLGILPETDGGTLIIIETKGQSTTDRELIEEIKKFASKLRTLEGSLAELTNEFSYGVQVKTLRGIFVSMARLHNFECEEENVELWDFDMFVTELRKARVPPHLTNLLEPMTIAITFPSEALSWQTLIEPGKS